MESFADPRRKRILSEYAWIQIDERRYNEQEKKVTERKKEARKYIMKKELLQDLKEAMKNKDTLRKDTITMLRAAILQVEKDSQKVLNDDEICAIVAKEVKKRKESVKEYEDAGREDIADNLKKEIEILSKYLPEQLTEDEIRKMVEDAIVESGAASPRDMGKVMSILRPKTAGKADGKLVSDIVKEKLANM